MGDTFDATKRRKSLATVDTLPLLDAPKKNRSNKRRASSFAALPPDTNINITLNNNNISQRLRLLARKENILDEIPAGMEIIT